MVVTLKKGSAVRSSRDSVAFDFRDRIELRRRRGRIIDSTTNLKLQQSVTYQYREFPVPGISHFFGGIGTGIGANWYREKVSEPVSENLVTDKSLGTGIGKI